jgi:hypothetical protein
METKVSTSLGETIDYKLSSNKKSYYRHQKVVQNTGSEQLIIGASQQVTTFEIPVIALNLSKSYLNFRQTVPAQGAGQYAHMFRHTVPWSRLELFTRSGTYLCDLNFAAEAMLAIQQRTKKIEDFHGSYDNILTRQSLNELNIRVEEISTANQPDNIEWRIRFEELYETVLSLDKSLNFGEVLNLRITWKEAPAHGYQSDNAAAQAGTMTALTGNVTISNLALFVAGESNPDIVGALRETVATGNMPPVLIPYTFVYKTNINNQTSQAVSTRFSRGHGSRLVKVMTLFNSGDETVNLRYDADLDPADFVSFYTLLNSRRTTEFDVVVADGVEDYQWMRAEQHKDLVVSLSPDNNQDLFAWEDDWSNSNQASVNQEIAGLPLDDEIKYDLYVTATGATVSKNYYTVGVCQRMLSITPSGVVVG